MHKWYQEPLLHFLLLGAILFYISYINEPKEKIQTQKHLTVTKSDIEQLLTQWKQQKNSLPNKEELNKLLEYYIEDEILYQEALRMKLDINEPDIKQILIEKLKYVSNNSIKIDEIPKETLYAYFQKHKEKFTKKNSKKISFTQIYLNPKKHNNIDVKANFLYRKINSISYENNLSTLGDKFYAGNNFQNIDEKGLSKSFSRSFIRELFKLSEKQWSKPIKSGFGIHIIYIENSLLSKEVTFNDVEQQVKNKWLIEENYNAYKTLYKKLKEEYTVTIERNDYKDEIR